MKTLKADWIVARDCMDSLYAIYMAAVESFGGDPNNFEARAEGEEYARRKFCEIAEEFENLYGSWSWYEHTGEEESEVDD